MITKGTILQWMQRGTDSGQYDTAASLAQECFDEHNILKVLASDFSLIIHIGFRLARPSQNKTETGLIK